MRPFTYAAAATVLSLVLAGSASDAFAQAAAPGPAPSPHADGARDALRSASDLKAVFGSIAPTGPGCAAGVVREGQPAMTGAWGMADLEHPDPLTSDSVFESGSVAKQFTAAAVLLLVQDGKLSLDDDIRRYLPELPDYGVPITIRHLLTHTSGLREQWSLLALTGNPPAAQVHNQATILDLASRQKGLNFRPGTEFLYTNTNYTLAAIIIARVSDQSVQQFTDQRLFAPLGMSHTRWREDFRTVVPGRATAYFPTDDGFIAGMPLTNVYGNGGLLTTVGDLLRWNAFLDHPTELAGGEAMVRAMQTPGRLNDGTVLQYGLGFELSQEHGRRLVAHSGSTGGYKTWLGRYPEAGVSVAVLCNHGGLDPVVLGEGLAAKALGASEGVEAPVTADAAPLAGVATPLPADLTPYLGQFRNPVTGELVRTAFVNGRLTLTRRASEDLIPVGNETFRRAGGGDLHFVFSQEAPSELLLGAGPSQARYVAVRPASPDPATLTAYIGTYYSPELDTRVVVSRKGDALVMQQAFAIEWPLTPSFVDGFLIPVRGSTTVVFTRTESGSVDGFRAWANGARNIEFKREP